MRLIDALPLIDECEEMISIEDNHKVAPPSWANAEEEFLQRLLDAPTVDAVKVVRCMKCKHSDTECHKDGLRYCMRGIKSDDYDETGYIYPLEVIVRDDDFCSYGEKRF